MKQVLEWSGAGYYAACIEDGAQVIRRMGDRRKAADRKARYTGHGSVKFLDRSDLLGAYARGYNVRNMGENNADR